MSTTQDAIQKLVDDHSVVLFMKGTSLFPQCGFSGFVVQVLQSLEVDFQDINVLEDPLMRQGIKDFSSWPTIPQLYVRGEFIGGADIVKEMMQSGELQALFVGE
ncbi:MAG: Grx4 family monothiol glutaredoxin [Simkaniaceae bacterium]|nr:Grx4 family monothiol glutaredoxin [Simkaniaceae bacterium]